jgi:BirA family biotin operon repressor/biotin-[acetyl-CoA-carboxylase] ligase
MSVVLEPDFLGIDNQFLLNAMVALACFDVFSKYAGDDTSIKWPNDIYWKDRKAGGILIENVIQGKEWRFSVAGMGININQTFFPAHLPNPVSLKQITGKNFDVIQLAKEICKYLNYRWEQLRSQKNDNLLQEYSNNLYKSGELVTFKKNDKEFKALVTGVNKKGELIVDAGAPITFTHGAVDWILPQPK